MELEIRDAMHVDQLDDLLGTPARLAILATLMDGQRWTFSALGRETGLADGNLHVQVGRLTAARLAARERTAQGRRTVTSFEITEKGRRVFTEHVRRLKEIVDPRVGFPAERATSGRPGDGSRVW